MIEHASIVDGSHVRFLPDTPPYAKNRDTVFVVDGDPKPDNTPGGSPWVWLVLAADTDKAPSRQRRRSGRVDALEVVDERA